MNGEPIGMAGQNPDAAPLRTCDRCRRAMRGVRWVSRIGAWMCPECRSGERAYAGRK